MPGRSLERRRASCRSAVPFPQFRLEKPERAYSSDLLRVPTQNHTGRRREPRNDLGPVVAPWLDPESQSAAQLRDGLRLKRPDRAGLVGHPAQSYRPPVSDLTEAEGNWREPPALPSPEFLPE